MSSERSQKDPFQEGLHVGLGLALRAKERIEEWGNKISKEYEMNEEEGKKFVEDLVNSSEETKTKLDEVIEKRFQQYLSESDIPSKKDIDKLTKKLTELEKKIDQQKS
jgi:polyhydroxyalkanoate synthesis regulator phasin